MSIGYANSNLNKIHSQAPLCLGRIQNRRQFMQCAGEEEEIHVYWFSQIFHKFFTLIIKQGP